ncbi:MAG: hypothetical protein EBZ83_02635 [Verrucomicrobia bacterium]|nr:hypothetical protein [Verrucomicrobiota bacterium]
MSTVVTGELPGPGDGGFGPDFRVRARRNRLTAKHQRHHQAKQAGRVEGGCGKRREAEKTESKGPTAFSPGFFHRHEFSSCDSGHGQREGAGNPDQRGR